MLLAAVSDAVKARVAASGGLVAANECTDVFDPAHDKYAGAVKGKLPASLDIISVDTCESQQKLPAALEA